MPELPEVETTRRGIAPHLIGRRIETLTVRNRALRWPVSRALPGRVRGQEVEGVQRRAKYLLIGTGPGDLFTGITPVRLLDSRSATGIWNGPLPAGAPRDLVVRKPGNGLGVPATATAVAIACAQRQVASIASRVWRALRVMRAATCRTR